jgi:hypothetical protein
MFTFIRSSHHGPRPHEVFIDTKRPFVRTTTLGVDQVAGLGDAGDQRMVDPHVVVAIVLGTGLVAVHFDG